MMTNLERIWKFLVMLPAALAWHIPVSGQQITLGNAIATAQKQSLAYKVAQNRFQSSSWNFQNYRVFLFPTLHLDGTVPNYARMITKITLPNGDDTFVNQNQAYSSAFLGLRQNVAATGGVLSLGSTLSRIDVFGNNRAVIYSSAPISIAYSQHTVGYNEFKWLKQTEPLRFELADREFISSMEEIGLAAVELFFDVLAVQARRTLSEQNLANADTLLRISNDRFRLGTVTQSELLQLKLTQLNARKQLTQDSVDQVLAQQKLTSYLAYPADSELHVHLPEDVRFFRVEMAEAIEMALGNGQQVLRFRLNRLEAEKSLAQVKAENKLKFNIQANFGLSNVASDIPGLFRQMENQQNVALNFSLPILDWGNAKTKRLQAEANLALVESQIEQEQMEIEQEIALQISRWNLQKQQITIAQEARVISEQNYELEKQRFLAGNITLNDLNISQTSKDNAVVAYYEALRVYWQLHYTIRKLTLYNFEKKEPLKYVILDYVN